MKQNLKNSVGGGNRLLGQLASEKKKTFIAVFLIIVMVFMWVRVLGRNGPKGASAAVRSKETTEDQANARLKVSFIELPIIDGRNDVLTRDFFAVGSWQDFMTTKDKNSNGTTGISVSSRNGSEESIRRAAEKLKLEAIVLGENHRAFINDKLLSVGDKLFIKDGINIYECELAEIGDTTVLIRCGESEVTLRLMQTSEIDY